MSVIQVSDTWARWPPPLRRAFVPSLFAARGLQPLRVLGDWDARVEHNGGEMASVNALNRPPRPGDPSYLAGWAGHFDYVLVLNADLPDASGAFRPPPNLSLVADQGFAHLWRVTGTGEASAPRPPISSAGPAL